MAVELSSGALAKKAFYFTLATCVGFALVVFLFVLWG